VQIVLLLDNQRLFNVDFYLGFLDLGLFRHCTLADLKQTATYRGPSQDQKQAGQYQAHKPERQAFLPFQNLLPSTKTDFECEGDIVLPERVHGVPFE
jgi:hypothetical protein